MCELFYLYLIFFKYFFKSNYAFSKLTMDSWVQIEPNKHGPLSTSYQESLCPQPWGLTSTGPQIAFGCSSWLLLFAEISPLNFSFSDFQQDWAFSYLAKFLYVYWKIRHYWIRLLHSKDKKKKTAPNIAHNRMQCSSAMLKCNVLRSNKWLSNNGLLVCFCLDNVVLIWGRFKGFFL